MLNIRIVTAGAILFAMAGTAAAQSDTSQAPSQDPGKPVSLLQILLKPSAASSSATASPSATDAPDTTETAETTVHTKTVHRHWHRHRYASKKSHPAQDDEAAATTPAAQSDAAQANATPAAADATAPSAQATATFDTQATASLPGTSATIAAPSEPSAMVVDGHTVQITSQDQINALDLAADSTASAPPQPATEQANTTFDAMAAADNMPVTESSPAADSKPADTPVVAYAERDDGGNNNRDIWYEDLLAILGGVLAAASVAWFLIGYAPPRRDGREPMLAYEIEPMRR